MTNENTSALTRPDAKPACPNFSSGPCAKRPNHNLAALSDACLGRSHRSGVGKAKLNEAIERTRDALNIPADYRVGIVPASDTGAFEMAMWNLLGERGVDIFAWESFGQGWLADAKKHLALGDLREFVAEYGALPDMREAAPDRDIIFTYNGTTSGVCVPNTDFIAAERTGLTLCDATSAAFAFDMDWSKLDVTTFSWQKVLGSEGAHGMLILSPRAVARLCEWTPPRPLPKIFRLTKGGELIEGIFKGETINTPSMLAVEDYLDALRWVESEGGLHGLLARIAANNKVLGDWVAATDWIDFLCDEPALRSPTSVCLKLNDASVDAKTLCKRLEAEGAAYDIGAYRDAPAGLRIWAGATVEATDLAALTQWLDYTFQQIKGEHNA